MEYEPQKTTYRHTRKEIKERMQSTGNLICQLITLLGNQTSEQFQLLCRVFNEHYKVLENRQVELRPKEEIKSIQSSNISPLLLHWLAFSSPL